MELTGARAPRAVPAVAEAGNGNGHWNGNRNDRLFNEDLGGTACTPIKYETANGDGALGFTEVDAVESSEETTLRWLLDMDMSEPEENYSRWMSINLPTRS